MVKNLSMVLDDKRGFTLLETVLTLFILVTLTGLVLSSLRLGIRAWERGEKFIEESSVKRTIASRLSAEVGSIYLYPVNDDGGSKYLFRGAEDNLGFVTFSNNGIRPPWGGLTSVYYFVDKDGLSARLKSLPDSDAEISEGGHLVSLSGEVSNISFEYLGQSGWERNWDADEKRSLPFAVRTKVFFRSGKTFLLTMPVYTAVAQENVSQP
ncbi:MAG: hypothetical protein HYS21_11390 [Deltaproteobacteria bacterium]|nr:hypothetical protein [Deltaproteobacteria bacterium]